MSRRKSRVQAAKQSFNSPRPTGRTKSLDGHAESVKSTESLEGYSIGLTDQASCRRSCLERKASDSTARIHTEKMANCRKEPAACYKTFSRNCGTLWLCLTTPLSRQDLNISDGALVSVLIFSHVCLPALYMLALCNTCNSNMPDMPAH